MLLIENREFKKKLITAFSLCAILCSFIGATFYWLSEKIDNNRLIIIFDMICYISCCFVGALIAVITYKIIIKTKMDLYGMSIKDLENVAKSVGETLTFSHGRPVITVKMGEKIDCPFPPEPNL